MTKNWRSEWPHWLLLIGMFLMGAIAWPHTSEPVPVHWGFDSTADRYGGRVEGVLLLPLLTLGVYLFMLLSPRLDPGRANYVLFAGAYALIRFAVLALLVAVYGAAVLSATGNALDMARVMPLLIGTFLVVIGSVMGKLRPTWFVGVRTPWTLSSARAWGKTQRLGGWVFIGAGLLLLLGGLLRLPAITMIALVALIAGSLGLYAYSYAIWRKDRGAVPPAGSQPVEEG